MNAYEEIYQLCRFVEDNSYEEYKESIADLVENLPEASRLAGILKKYESSKDIRDWYSFVMYFENRLNIDLKDEDFLKIQTEDHEKVSQIYPYIVVLDHLRSSWNVGNILRSAEAFGASEVILSGYTPSLSHSKVKKASLGVESRLNIKSVEKVDLKSFKEKGYRIYGVETHKEASPLETSRLAKKAVFVFGNERFGLRKEQMGHIDEYLAISLCGGKQSLNVGNALAITAYEYIRQHGSLST